MVSLQGAWHLGSQEPGYLVDYKPCPMTSPKWLPQELPRALTKEAKEPKQAHIANTTFWKSCPNLLCVFNIIWPYKSQVIRKLCSTDKKPRKCLFCVISPSIWIYLRIDTISTSVDYHPSLQDNFIINLNVLMMFIKTWFYQSINGYNSWSLVKSV